MSNSIKNLFLEASIFKFLCIALVLLSLLILPLNQNRKFFIGNTEVSPQLYSFYQWDAINYKYICDDGYFSLFSNNYIEAVKNTSYLPGLPFLNCVLKPFPAVIDMSLYGPMIINFVFWLLTVFSLRYYLEGYITDEKQRKYMLMFYFTFPFAFFFHLNYTEAVFLPLSLFALRFTEQRDWARSALMGFFASFVRVTSLPLGFLMMLRFFYLELKDHKQTLVKIIDYPKLLIKLLSFSAYSIGVIMTFIYFHIKYGNFWLFFESQKLYFGRNTTLESFWKSIRQLFGQADIYWYSFDFIKQTGENWSYLYNQHTIYWILYAYPVFIILLGSILLIKNKKFFEFLLSWSLLIVPILSDSNSISRYILQSFPFILVIAQELFRFKILSKIVLFIHLLLFCIVFVLHTRGYWIG
jgi:hypothetical protein